MGVLSVNEKEAMNLEEMKERLQGGKEREETM